MVFFGEKACGLRPEKGRDTRKKGEITRKKGEMGGVKYMILLKNRPYKQGKTR